MKCQTGRKYDGDGIVKPRLIRGWMAPCRRKWYSSIAREFSPTHPMTRIATRSWAAAKDILNEINRLPSMGTPSLCRLTLQLIDILPGLFRKLCEGIFEGLAVVTEQNDSVAFEPAEGGLDFPTV